MEEKIMDNKIFMKKMLGYIWVFIAFLWSIVFIPAMVNLINNDHVSNQLFLLILSIVNILLGVLNAVLILSGKKYTFLKKEYIEMKNGILKPKIIPYSEIVTLYKSEISSRKSLILETKSKTYTIYDIYTIPFTQLKLEISKRFSQKM